MSIQVVFDSFRNRLRSKHRKGDGLNDVLDPATDQLVRFAKGLHEGLEIPIRVQWQNSGNVPSYIWVRLLPETQVRDFVLKTSDFAKAIPFTISLFLTKSSSDPSLMALTASFELERDDSDLAAYQAYNSVLDSVPSWLEFHRRDGAALTREQAREYVSAPFVPGDRKNHICRIAKTVDEAPGKPDAYYRDILSKAFDEILKLYWIAYKDLMVRRASEDRCGATLPPPDQIAGSSALVIKKDPSFPLNLILQGPPGTGKTYRSIALASAIAQGNYPLARDIVSGETIQGDNYKELQSFYQKDLLAFDKDGKPLGGHIAFTTFHQSYSYEEFVEGIFPEVKDGALSYSVKDGVFKAIADLAHEHPHENYVLLIDEINRGNVSKILGDLISLIEEDKRLGGEHELKAVLPYSRALWGVPSNLYLVGTMNTADRSIERLDTALMRRFSFYEIDPNPALLSNHVLEEGNKLLPLQELLEAMNERIRRHLGPEKMIGHSYFLGLGKEVSLEKLAEVFRNKILPTLLESALGDYRKVKRVLGEKEDAKDGIVRALWGEDSYEDPSGYAFHYEALLSFETYRKIAGTGSSLEDEEA